jgi:hypothetical protein
MPSTVNTAVGRKMRAAAEKIHPNNNTMLLGLTKNLFGEAAIWASDRSIHGDEQTEYI